jgi:hypothetical protein
MKRVRWLTAAVALRLLPLVMIFGCAPTRYVPAASGIATEQARAEFQCEQTFQHNLAMHMATNEYGGLYGFQKGRFMRACMRAQGYEVAE